MNACLHRLLDANLRLPPEYDDGLTNHLPMALHALQRLGASDARLQSFFDGYTARFGARLADPPAEPMRDWQALRGAPGGCLVLLATFRHLLDDTGRDAVLRAALPDLLPGVAAAAFHGPIRTAHAASSGHDGELAAALAYWAWRWQPLRPPPVAAPMDFDAWTAALVAAAPGCRPHGRLISLRMQQVEAGAAYRTLAGAAEIRPELLPRLTAWAAERYSATRDFTVLHIVTGLNAVRVLLPWIADPAAALRPVVHAVAAAYLSSGVAAAPPRSDSRAAWPEIIDRALASDDDHVIKLVQACRDLEAAHGGDHWRSAAAAAWR